MLGHLRETVKLKAETIEAVKEPATSQTLTTELGKIEAEKSPKQRSLMSTIERKILSIARKLCCCSGGKRRKRCKLQQDQTSN